MVLKLRSEILSSTYIRYHILQAPRFLYPIGLTMNAGTQPFLVALLESPPAALEWTS